MKRGMGISGLPSASAGETVAMGAARAAGRAGQEADGLAAWLAKYKPVERAVIEAHERRKPNHAAIPFEVSQKLCHSRT